MDFNIEDIDLEEKRDFIFQKADFIIENEDLFKTGTYKLKKKEEKKLEFNNISIKEKHYIIEKKKIDDNIELLEKNIINQHEISSKNIMEFNIRKSILDPNKINFFKGYNNKNKSRNSIINISNLSSTKSMEKTLISKKINLIKKKQNKTFNNTLSSFEKKKIISFPKIKLKDVLLRKTFFKIPTLLSKSINQKPKIKKQNKLNNNKTYDAEDLINDLRRTQLKFILKNEDKINKEKGNYSNNFNIACKNYFKSHKHNNYFNLTIKSKEDRFINNLNKYEKSKKEFPKLKKAINEIEGIEGENEKRKIICSDYYFCINENLNKLRKKIKIRLNDKKRTILSSKSFEKKTRHKVRLKTSFNQRNIDPINNTRKKNDIELILSDIEKESDFVNKELNNWKKV